WQVISGESQTPASTLRRAMRRVKEMARSAGLSRRVPRSVLTQHDEALRLRAMAQGQVDEVDSRWHLETGGVAQVPHRGRAPRRRPFARQHPQLATAEIEHRDLERLAGLSRSHPVVDARPAVRWIRARREESGRSGPLV